MKTKISSLSHNAMFKAIISNVTNKSIKEIESIAKNM